MKVLIESYFHASGWGDAARRYALALSKYVDVVCKSVNSAAAYITDDVSHLFSKSYNDITHCLQIVFPHDVKKYPGVQNICLYFAETDNISHLGWPEYLSQMDQVWVPNTFMENAFGGNFVPIPCDPDIYNKQYQVLSVPELKDKFVFYFIGELTRRKNISAILTSFHRAFNGDDDVGLVLKLNKTGTSPDECFELASKQNEIIIEKLHKKNTANVVVLTERLTNEQIYGLHQSANCFVCASYGESWCQPAFDALAFGNYLVYNTLPGLNNFSNKKSFFVSNVKDICIGADQFIPGLHGPHENWWSVSTTDLASKMIYAYNQREDRRPDLQLIDEFSYDTIGLKMKSLLEGC